MGGRCSIRVDTAHLSSALFDIDDLLSRQLAHPRRFIAIMGMSISKLFESLLGKKEMRKSPISPVVWCFRSFPAFLRRHLDGELSLQQTRKGLVINILPGRS